MHIGAINLRLRCFLRQNTKIKREEEVSLGHVFQQLHRSSAQANTLRCQLSSDTRKRGQYPGNVSRPPGHRGAALADPPHVAVSLLCGCRSAGHGARRRLTSRPGSLSDSSRAGGRGGGCPGAAPAPHRLCGSNDSPAPRTAGIRSAGTGLGGGRDMTLSTVKTGATGNGEGDDEVGAGSLKPRAGSREPASSYQIGRAHV